MSIPDKPLNELFTSLPTTIFEVMSKLAVAHSSVNLGQGFPDEEGPNSMKKVAGDALVQFHNQYPSLLGVPELRQAVARHSETHQGVAVDWETEALVTVGATEAIASVFLGLLNPGDEVIIFDPMYDSYVTMCKRSGGVLRPVPLSLPSLGVPADALAAAFTPRTKFILLNTPHNPTGKVFSREELQLVADLCIRHNVYAVCDEVYEHQVFEGHPHITLRSLPGMRDRTVRMGSAGKTFSFTAWKVGWATGPPHLMAAIIKAHQFLVFTVPSSLQHAVAYGLDHEAAFYTGMAAGLQKKRQYLEAALQQLGLTVLPAHGTYFLVADVSKFQREGEDDVAFCKRLTVEGGVTLIPISPFYVSEAAPTHLVRFCFCKDDAKLEAAVQRLQAYLRPHAAQAYLRPHAAPQ